MARLLALGALLGAARAAPIAAGKSQLRSAAVEAAPAATAGAAPNVVLTLVDDLGAGDVGYNDASMETPELQRLAAEGLVLDSYYAASQCTPSRAMLMTGRYNIRSGMQDSVIHSTEPRGVPLDEKFLPEKLSEAGYNTAAVGKWHLGMHQEAYTPTERGFDLFYGILTGGGSHTGHFSVSQPFTVRGQEKSATWQGFNLWENGAPSPDNQGKTHSTHLYTAKAAEYIAAFESDDFDASSYARTVEKQSSKKPKKQRRLGEKAPWFVYLSYQAVHDPIEAGDQKYITETKCANASAALREDAVSSENRGTLCGMVAEVDDGLKTVRLAVEQAGAWDNTVVIVASDNGGVQAHGSSNYPLRGEKGQYWEGGVRVPALIGGGFVAALVKSGGARVSSLAHVTDLHASILSLAGYEASDEDKPLDGVDLLPHLVSEATGGAVAAPRADVLININSALFAGSGALVSGNFKLVVNPEPSESGIYAKVRRALAARSGKVSSDDFSAVVAEAHAEALGSGEVLLFDLAANPSERTDCATDDATSCNLYDMEAYETVQKQLEQKWSEYQIQSVPSSFAWEDDGPLADPELFGGVWSAWRDADGVPKASYKGLASMSADDVERASRGEEGSYAATYFGSTTSLLAGAGASSTGSTFLMILGSFAAGALVSNQLAAWSRRRHGHLPLLD